MKVDECFEKKFTLKHPHIVARKNKGVVFLHLFLPSTRISPKNRYQSVGGVKWLQPKLKKKNKQKG